MDKKVSILIPCYNSGKWVARCVQSLINQTIDIQGIEMILVDDCSEDDTWKVLCQLEQQYPSDMILIIKSDEHLAPGGARNLALSYATAPFVAMVDSDDWVETDYLEKMVGAAIRDGSDLVCCNAIRDYGDGRAYPLQYHHDSKLYEVDSLERRKQMLLQGSIKGRMLARREYLLENKIFYPAGIVYEDICWNALNYGHMKKMSTVAECLYHYFVNPDSVVMKKEQDYFHDMFEANYIKWDEMMGRGFYELMPREIEFDMLISYYLFILKLYKLHFDTIPLSGFQEMQDFVNENMPDYRNNPYLDQLLTPGQRQLIGFLGHSLTEGELKELHAVLCKMQDL